MEKLWIHLVIITIFLANCNLLVDGNSAGAPITACTSMKPQPTHLASGQQTSVLPYLITSDKLTYSAGESIRGIYLHFYYLELEFNFASYRHG